MASRYSDASRPILRQDAGPPGVQLVNPKSLSSVSHVTSFDARGFSAQHVRVTTHESFACGWQGDSYYVALHDLRTTDSEIFAADDSVARERDLRGRLAYVPAHCQTWGWMAPTPGPQSFTALYLTCDGLDDDLAQRLRRLPQRARVYFFDGPLFATLSKLRTCLTADTPADGLYVESLCMLAAVELCRNTSVRENDSGALSGRMTERVIEYMEQHLHRDIGLEQLAQVANLSRFHFLRAFRRATRATPYQYLLQRRIERSKELLRAGRLSIAEIAAEVGFRNSTCFAAAFRKQTNTTPSTFRATVRN